MTATDSFTEILEDVREECGKYGSVLDMKIPRPSGGSRQSNGVGKIYVKYDSNESAQKALRALAGRKFADRTVVVTFFVEVSQASNYLYIVSLVLIFYLRNTSMSTLGRRSGAWTRGHCICPVRDLEKGLVSFGLRLFIGLEGGEKRSCVH